MSVIERWTLMFSNDGPTFAVEGHDVRAFPELARLAVVDVESYDALAEQLQGAVAALEACKAEAKQHKDAYLAMREENGILRQRLAEGQ